MCSCCGLFILRFTMNEWKEIYSIIVCLYIAQLTMKPWEKVFASATVEECHVVFLVQTNVRRKWKQAHVGFVFFCVCFCGEIIGLVVHFAFMFGCSICTCACLSDIKTSFFVFTFLLDKLRWKKIIMYNNFIFQLIGLFFALTLALSLFLSRFLSHSFYSFFPLHITSNKHLRKIISFWDKSILSKRKITKEKPRIQFWRHMFMWNKSKKNIFQSIS